MHGYVPYLHMDFPERSGNRLKLVPGCGESIHLVSATLGVLVPTYLLPNV
jgi:hypothetical protein